MIRGQMRTVDEELESLCDSDLGAVRLGQRGYLHRVLQHKGRLLQTRLSHCLEHLVEQVTQ